MITETRKYHIDKDKPALYREIDSHKQQLNKDVPNRLALIHEVYDMCNHGVFNTIVRDKIITEIKA